MSIVFAVSADTLVVFDTLSPTISRYTIPQLFRHFQERQWMTMQSRELDKEYANFGASEFAKFDGVYVSVLDYSSDSIRIKKVSTDSMGLSDYCLQKGNAYVSDGKLVVDICLSVQSLDYRSVTYDKSLSLQSKVSAEVFIDSSFSSYMGGGLNHRLVGQLYFHKDHLLKASTTRIPLQLWPNYSLQTPYDTLNGYRYTSLKILYNTTTSNWLIGQRRPADTFTQRAEVYIYHKATTSWHVDSLPLYNTPPAVYNDSLLYGTIYAGCHPPTCDERAEILKFKNAYPDKYEEKFGFTPSVARMTGKLFFYDLDNKSYAEIRISEPDVEALSMQEGIFYFRVYDSIYQIPIAQISESILQDATLIVRDSVVVPHVHSLFIHKSK